MPASRSSRAPEFPAPYGARNASPGEIGRLRRRILAGTPATGPASIPGCAAPFARAALRDTPYPQVVPLGSGGLPFLRVSHEPVTTLLKLPVQIIQDDVRQDRRQRGTLRGPFRRRRNHVRQLEALGYTVTLEPASGPAGTTTIRLRAAAPGLPRARQLPDFRISWDSEAQGPWRFSGAERSNTSSDANEPDRTSHIRPTGAPQVSRPLIQHDPVGATAPPRRHVSPDVLPSSSVSR